MKKIKHSLLDSFNYAIEGIITAVKLERNMKIHLGATIAVIIVALFMKINTLNLAILSIAISMVWVAELLNSAIEKVVDLVVGTKYHPLAKKAKDIAAGAVLVAAINSVIIAYLVFDDHAKSSGKKLFNIVKVNNSHIGVISLVVVAILVVIIKAFFNKGTPLQGGMPSGHSALAFSAATLIIFNTNSVGISVLTVFIALLVAQSRIKTGVHSFLEVFFGALLGFGVTSLLILLFQGI
jgi:diacylglycerol kinase (ATP)